MYVNGKLMKEISNIAKTDTFGGGALAVPFRAAGQGQEGYLLDLVIYASALSEVEMSAARQQYIQ